MRIYTLGYQGHTVATFDALVERLGVTQLCDVRGVPRSRVAGFSGKALADRFGERYEAHGATLGNRGEGRVSPEGLALVGAWSASRASGVVALLCQCGAPGDCHRHQLIAVPLLERGVDLVHVYAPRGEEVELIRASELQRALDADDDYEYETID